MTIDFFPFLVDDSADVSYDSSKLPTEDSDEDHFCGSDRFNRWKFGLYQSKAVVRNLLVAAAHLLE